MEKNNGKIAIAIVAMFVVALSVVGFTYAYFTATVTGNQNNTSATVVAGELVATYTGTNTDALSANNIVPGWKSDGLHFYDPTYAYDVDANGAPMIVSCVTSDDKCNKTTYGNQSYGLSEPIKFTVKSDTDVNDIYYAIQLETVALSDAVTEDLRASLVATLYEGTFNAEAENYGGSVVKSLPIAAKNGEITLAGPVTLGAGLTKNYFIVVELVNDEDAAQNDLQGISFTVKSSAVGIAENADGDWVDEEGNTIIAKAN